MNKKYVILLGILIIGIIILLFRQSIYSFTDIKYLQGKSQYSYLPKDIQQKHSATIEKVDALIQKENKENITSQSKNFDLQVYLKNVQIGVFPYLQKDDPLKQETQSLIQDILNHIK